ncbi:hypothetical protein KSS87_020315 [Heliosperma pusillum]|nr:hypothetical protein KSS87_020315 [Heliosperma pusillum]
MSADWKAICIVKDALQVLNARLPVMMVAHNTLRWIGTKSWPTVKKQTSSSLCKRECGRLGRKSRQMRVWKIGKNVMKEMTKRGIVLVDLNYTFDKRCNVELKASKLPQNMVATPSKAFIGFGSNPPGHAKPAVESPQLVDHIGGGPQIDTVIL